jgi:hypothetical protein
MATKTKAAPAAKKAASNPAAKATPKTAPKKRAPRKKAAPKEPAWAESVSVIVGDAHVVLGIDGKEFRLDSTAVYQLYHDFERANLALN